MTFQSSKLQILVSGAGVGVQKSSGSATLLQASIFLKGPFPNVEMVPTGNWVFYRSSISETRFAVPGQGFLFAGAGAELSLFNKNNK